MRRSSQRSGFRCHRARTHIENRTTEEENGRTKTAETRKRRARTVIPVGRVARSRLSRDRWVAAETAAIVVLENVFMAACLCVCVCVIMEIFYLSHVT